MKTTNFRTVEELSLDVNVPTVTPTKVQNDKIVRALKKLSVTDPDETLIIKIVSAFVALGVNPQAKSSSWLAWRLKNHLQAFGFLGAQTFAIAEA
jgi:DNA topoisomerase IB